MKIKCQEYEWCFDESTGKLTCSKNGLKWRDETGDHAVLALLEVACELKEQPVTVVDASAVVEKKKRPFPKFMVYENLKDSPVFFVTKKMTAICIKRGNNFYFGEKLKVGTFYNLIDLEGEAELQYVTENDDVFPRFEKAYNGVIFFCTKKHYRVLDTNEHFLKKGEIGENLKPFTEKFTVKNKDVDILSDKTFYRITAQKAIEDAEQVLKKYTDMDKKESELDNI